MSWNKRIAVLLIVLFVGAVLTAASHHHENSADDHDCPICLANHHLAAIQPAAAFDGALCFCETASLIPAPELAGWIFTSLLGTRAPPA